MLVMKLLLKNFRRDELSILTITDGYSFYNLPAAQDHKRIGDGDKGLNTGGKVLMLQHQLLPKMY